VLDGRTIHIGDIQTEADEFPTTSQNARRQGYRTILGYLLYSRLHSALVKI
jgi:hypothetical protein